MVSPGIATPAADDAKPDGIAVARDVTVDPPVPFICRAPPSSHCAQLLVGRRRPSSSVRPSSLKSNQKRRGKVNTSPSFRRAFLVEEHLLAGFSGKCAGYYFKSGRDASKLRFFNIESNFDKGQYG